MAQCWECLCKRYKKIDSIYHPWFFQCFFLQPILLFGHRKLMNFFPGVLAGKIFQGSHSPDFSLTKKNIFYWENYFMKNYVYMVVHPKKAQIRVQSFKIILTEISWLFPKIFLRKFNCKNWLTKIKIPWQFPDFEKSSEFTDFSMTVGQSQVDLLLYEHN